MKKLFYASMLFSSLAFSQDISKIIQKETKIQSDSLEVLAREFYDVHKKITCMSNIPSFIDEEIQISNSDFFSIQYINADRRITYEILFDPKTSFSIYLFRGIAFDNDLENASEEVHDLKFDGLDRGDIYTFNKQDISLKNSKVYFTVAENYYTMLELIIDKLSFDLWVCKDIEKENLTRIGAISNP